MHSTREEEKEGEGEVEGEGDMYVSPSMAVLAKCLEKDIE